ncbi:hypothetical protein [Paenarthrobacter sp. PH39-S1]|uniref:hypothetical protein n=1 Tax=Paenarthrobacter sp. PH39-S1 TaxID=3046204 RepID=UPI0024BB5E62|nr:hypothetical protein [Paenarthrobacter sp. PH39-S1]MDJ0355028.1 hypothetical protein [Paenarthrobacter sp. PH39-S1]
MSDDSLKQVRIAAADLETLEFERDAATMTLQDAVSEAVAHGGSVEAVAEASFLSVSEVEALTGPIDVVRPTEPETQP